MADKAIASVSVSVGADISGLEKGLTKAAAKLKNFRADAQSAVAAGIQAEADSISARSGGSGRIGGGLGGGFRPDTGATSLGELFGKKSGFGQAATLLKGGGAIAGLSILAKTIGHMGESASEASQKFAAGESSLGDFVESLALSIPIFGGAIKGIQGFTEAAVALSSKFFEKLPGFADMNRQLADQAFSDEMFEIRKQIRSRDAVEESTGKFREGRDKRFEDFLKDRNKGDAAAQKEIDNTTRLFGLKDSALAEEKFKIDLEARNISQNLKDRLLNQWKIKQRTEAQESKMEDIATEKARIDKENLDESEKRLEEIKQRKVDAVQSLHNIESGVLSGFSASQTKNAFGSLLGGKTATARIEQKVKDEFTGRKLDDIASILKKGIVATAA